MADDSGRIEIEISLDDGSVRRGFARVLSEGKDTAGVLEGSFDRIRNSILKWGAAYLSVRAGINFVKDSINAAAEQEVATNKLNNALALAGTFSRRASEQFQSMAEEIQKTTTIQDDHVLTLAALARNMSSSNEAAMRLTRAAIELGAATGKGPDAALQQLNGTLTGTAGRLTRIMPELANFTSAQLKAGAAIDYVNSRFAGAAAGEAKTFSGALTQLKNIFNDLQETIGGLITKSPAAVATFKFLSGEILKFNTALTQSSKGRDPFGDLAKSMSTFGLSVIRFVIVPIERLLSTLKTAFLSLEVFYSGVGGLQAKFEQKIADSKIGKFIEKLFPSPAEVKEKRQATIEAFDDTVKELKESFANIGNFDFSAGLANAVMRYQEALDQAKAVTNDAVVNMGADMDVLDGRISSLGETFSLVKTGMINSMLELEMNAKKTFQEIGGASIRIMVGGIASGMAAIGRALVKGENIFQAFAGAMLSALGQAAIQMGAMYILMGTARALGSYGLDATAWGLIATGTAMSVLGGALMAVGEGVSGGGGSTGVGAIGGGGGGVGALSTGQPGVDGQLTEDQRAKVVVNIQGDVFDTRETGLRIVELVQESFDTSGARLVVT